MKRNFDSRLQKIADLIAARTKPTSSPALPDNILLGKLFAEVTGDRIDPVLLGAMQEADRTTGALPISDPVALSAKKQAWQRAIFQDADASGLYQKMIASILARVQTDPH